MEFYTVVDPCFALNFDGTGNRCVEDGLAVARNDLSASPSVSIANGAPTGTGATNQIVNAWADGRDGLNHEHVLFSTSTGGGLPGTWSAPRAIETSPTDRGYYAAPAISPTGSDVWVVYNAFTTPFRTNTTSPRGLVGVVEHAPISAGTVDASAALPGYSAAIATTLVRPSASSGRHESPPSSLSKSRPSRSPARRLESVAASA
jgi:hypothetical protein